MAKVVFTGVCDSVHKGGVYPSIPCSRSPGGCAIPACIAVGIPACLAAGLQGGVSQHALQEVSQHALQQVSRGVVCVCLVRGVPGWGVPGSGGDFWFGGLLVWWPSGLVAFWFGSLLVWWPSA